MSDREMISDLLSALEYHAEQTRPIHITMLAIKAAREHLSKAAPAPVAQGETAACPYCGSERNERDELIKAEREIERLRAAMATPAPVAQPLTDEQLRDAFRTSADNLTLRAHWQGLKNFARAIERAHGITGDAS